MVLSLNLTFSFKISYAVKNIALTRSLERINTMGYLLKARTAEPEK
jgi:hypothetical protein